jgi:hypothetical protein
MPKPRTMVTRTSAVITIRIPLVKAGGNTAPVNIILSVIHRQECKQVLDISALSRLPLLCLCVLALPLRNLGTTCTKLTCQVARRPAFAFCCTKQENTRRINPFVLPRKLPYCCRTYSHCGQGLRYAHLYCLRLPFPCSSKYKGSRFHPLIPILGSFPSPRIYFRVSQVSDTFQFRYSR